MTLKALARQAILRNNSHLAKNVLKHAAQPLWAVAQIGGPIFSVGKNIPSVINDAADWVDPDELSHIKKFLGKEANVPKGTLVAITITPALAMQFKQRGGDIKMNWNELESAYDVPGFGTF